MNWVIDGTSIDTVQSVGSVDACRASCQDHTDCLVAIHDSPLSTCERMSSYHLLYEMPMGTGKTTIFRFCCEFILIMSNRAKG